MRIPFSPTRGTPVVFKKTLGHCVYRVAYRIKRSGGMPLLTVITEIAILLLACACVWTDRLE
jgi:hypothetical protein